MEMSVEDLLHFDIYKNVNNVPKNISIMLKKFINKYRRKENIRIPRNVTSKYVELVEKILNEIFKNENKESYKYSIDDNFIKMRPVYGNLKFIINYDEKTGSRPLIDYIKDISKDLKENINADPVIYNCKDGYDIFLKNKELTIDVIGKNFSSKVNNNGITGSITLPIFISSEIN